MEAKRAASFGGGWCFKVGCSRYTVTFGALSPLGSGRCMMKDLSLKPPRKKIPNLLKSIMGCALSCLFP